jgi:hypothetical protein
MRPMTGSLRLFGAAALVLLGGAWRAARAQPSPGPPEPGWTPSANITPWFQGSADISGGGGGFEASGGAFSVSVDGPIGNGHRASPTFTYSYSHYDFSSPAAFGDVAPWTDVHHVGLALPILLRGPSGWGVLVGPSLDYFLEDGADWSEAPTYGGVLAVAKSFGPNLLVGLGVSAFERLEEFDVTPFPVIDWRITDRLRLTNPLPAGPTGGGGLELTFQIDGAWTVGAGGAYRSARFRLRERGPFPNGIGEERAIPGFLHVGRRFGRAFALDVYAGALLGGRLRVEDSGGGKLEQQDFDPAPLVGGTLSTRF